MLSAVFAGISQVPVHSSVPAHRLRASHSANTRLHAHPRISAHMHKQINLYGDRFTDMGQRTHAIALFPPPTNTASQTLTAPYPSLVCVRVSAVGRAFLSAPLQPSSQPSVWIIQSSTGVESAYKVENTMNDSRMFKLDRTNEVGGGRRVWRQTVVVVDLRRIVFWGLREGG